MKKTICFVAGHSGGHIIPCITMAQHLRTEKKAATIFFFTTQSKLDMHITHTTTTIDQTIPLPLYHLPGKKVWRYPYFLYGVIVTFVKSFFYLSRLKPVKVISTGGMISIPVCLAAKLLRIKIELYELNVEPGKAITFLAPLADTFFICFKKTQNYLPKINCQQTTYPVRYTQDVKNINKQQTYTKIGLIQHQKKTLMIIGGSQGSLFLNDLINSFLEQENNLFNHLNIIHQIGSSDARDWQMIYSKYSVPAIIFNYRHDLAPYYNATDFIICRAGAGTLAEVLFFNKPCLTIPLETKNTSHQLLNAQAYAQEYPQLVQVMQQHEIIKNVAKCHTLIKNHFSL